MDNTVGSLTSKQKSLIFGSILGDGYVRIVPGRAEAFLEINHSFRAKEYVDWKFENLKSICKSPPKKRETGDGKYAYRFFTRSHPEITHIFEDFYHNERKIIPKSLELNPLILAVWFMDDGSKCRDRDIYLNTQQFSFLDQRRLLYLLRQMKIRARTNRDKKYYRIRILKESIPLFMEKVSPYIIPSLEYKMVKTENQTP